jgi:hypothetical protein
MANNIGGPIFEHRLWVREVASAACLGETSKTGVCEESASSTTDTECEGHNGIPHMHSHQGRSNALVIVPLLWLSFYAH